MADERDQQIETIVEALIRVGLVFFLLVASWRVFEPFLGLMLWALILAVALYPLHLKLEKKLGGKSSLAATLIVLIGLIGIGWPTVELASSFATHAEELYSGMSEGTLTIAEPKDSVAEWPVVGERLHSAWSAAANDLPAFVKANQQQLAEVTKKALSVTAGTMGSVFLFLGALIVAGIMMAYGEAASSSILNIFSRVSGPDRSVGLQALSTATIRSVATGVIGVAFIQALLLGVVYGFAGIPFASVLAVIVLFVGIIQVPATVVSIPVLIWLWTQDASATSNIIWTVVILVAGLADNVLKPLLLGRGVDAPMPVILIGALGGMVVKGMVGMFIGAVMLAVGYVVFMAWVNGKVDDPDLSAGEGESGSG
jgi:predicted PurR-regulated permease PerM